MKRVGFLLPLLAIVAACSNSKDAATSAPEADVTANAVAINGQASSPGDDRLAASIVDQLQCKDRPNPTPILIKLLDAGLINSEPDEGAESMPCFKLKRSVRLPSEPDAEEHIVAVCAFDPDFPEALKRAGPKYAKLYYRSPGTAPPHTISAYVDSNDLGHWEWWYRATFQGDLRSWRDSTLSFFDAGKVIAPGWVAGGSEIYCSDPTEVASEEIEPDNGTPSQ